MPADGERGAQRDPEQHRRERPDQSRNAPIDAVGTPRKKPATTPRMIASTIVITVAIAPTSSELRPP